MPPYGPFDLTFDNTFQALIPGVQGVAAVACRVPGVHLAWLSPTGWAYYLFSANADTDKQVTAVGAFQQAGADRDIYRTGQITKLIRASGLTEQDSLTLSTLFDSPSVIALAPTPDGQISGTPVYVEPGTFGIWRDGQGRINLDCKIKFPLKKSQRA